MVELTLEALEVDVRTTECVLRELGLLFISTLTRGLSTSHLNYKTDQKT